MKKGQDKNSKNMKKTSQEIVTKDSYKRSDSSAENVINHFLRFVNQEEEFDDPNRPETEEDDLRAGQLRILKARH